MILPRLALAAVVLLCLGSIALASRPVLRHAQGDLGPEPQAPRSVTLAQGPDLDITPILAAALFGRAPKPDSEATADLDLVLEGVALAVEPSQAFAMIRNGAQTRSYRIGAEIAPGTRLTQIAEGRVILDIRGTEVALDFEGAAPPAPKRATQASGAARLGALLGTQSDE